MAAKTNPNESAIDKTSFFYMSFCGICHPGGGPGEFDRDGYRYFDAGTGQFGYELSGADPTYSGDYTVLDPSTGNLSPAPWDVTGISEPDCLYCHRLERTVDGAMNMNWIWRAATVCGGAALVDGQGATVAAFAAAATAGQGWLSQIDLAQVPPGQPPLATLLQIDYSVGVADGSLVEGGGGELSLSPHSLGAVPKDYACRGCHSTADSKKRGQVWFDPDWDAHYAARNNLRDEEPANDIPASESRVCNTCHPGNLNHGIAKGNAFSSTVQNETDYVGFRTCRDCHLPGPLHDPDAREPEHPIHDPEMVVGNMIDVLACQACHIPYSATSADLVVDHAVTGTTVQYGTDEFLSADPLDPTDPDRSRWYPALKAKTDSDGLTRYFPAKTLLSLWWADWDDNGTPGDMSDDVVAPIPLWKVRQITGNAPLPGVTDDNGDGKMEVNRLAEINLYLQALKGNDSYGRQVAANPVLVKGGRIWHEDPETPPDYVTSFGYEGTGLVVESMHPFSMDHNVLRAGDGWGTEAGGWACGHCHQFWNGGQPTVVMDRLILVDPFDSDGLAVYETVKDMTGLNPQ
ncbi:MAG: hypothetical protein ACYSVY_08750 [Planctomycetota bacterium]